MKRFNFLSPTVVCAVVSFFVSYTTHAVEVTAKTQLSALEDIVIDDDTLDEQTRLGQNTIGGAVCNILRKVCNIENIIDGVGTSATGASILDKVCDLISCAPTPITGPTTITAAGSYCLTADFTASDTGIVIDASEVVLDLNRHTITGGTIGVEVVAGEKNVTIQNGLITGPSSGGVVVNTGCTNVMVMDVTVRECTGGGIRLDRTHDCLVQDCKVLACTAAPTEDIHAYAVLGDSVTTATGNRFINCHASDIKSTSSAAQGFFAENAHKTLFEDCSSFCITSSTGDAFGYFLDSSSNAVLKNCQSSDVQANGIVSGFEFNSSSDVYVEGCCSNNILSNNGNAIGYCFRSSPNASLKNCQSSDVQANGTGNAGFGMGFNFESNSSDALLEGCCSNNVLSNNGHAYGYGFFSSSNASLKNCQSSDVQANGVGFAGFGLGFSIESNSPHALLEGCCSNNVLSNNGPAMGYAFFSSSNAILKNCQSSDVQGKDSTRGFLVESSSDCIVDECCSNHVVSNSSNAVGLFAFDGDNVIFDSCITMSNSGPVNGIGLAIESSDNSCIVNSTAKECSSRAFHVVSGTGNQVKDNTAVSSGIGFEDDGTSSSFLGNYACGNTTNYDASISANGFPIVSAKAEGVGVTENVDCDSTESSLDGLILDKVCDIQTTVDNLGPCDPTAESGAVVISDPGTYCLSGDATSLSITGSNILFDMNGYRATAGITASGTPTDVTIKNGFVTGTVTITAGDRVRIEKLNVTGGGDGIILAGASQNCVIEDCILNNNTSEGLVIESTAFCNVVRNCVANENTADGFLISGFSNVLEDCTACLNMTIGFNVMSTGINCSFSRCSATDNTGDGFQIAGAANTFIDCVSLSNGSLGFDVTSAGDNCSFSRCSATDNTGDGFQISGVANTFIDCVSLSNGSIGFDVTSLGANCSLSRCSAIDNTGDGFDIAALNGIVRNCNATSNGGRGFDASAIDCVFIYCAALDNVAEGFNLAASNDLALECVARSNGISDLTGVMAAAMRSCMGAGVSAVPQQPASSAITMDPATNITAIYGRNYVY